jgi:hypothetical protein
VSRNGDFKKPRRTCEAALALKRVLSPKILSHHHASGLWRCRFGCFGTSAMRRNMDQTREVTFRAVALGLKSRSKKLGGGVGDLRGVRRVFFCCVVGADRTSDRAGEARERAARFRRAPRLIAEAKQTKSNTATSAADKDRSW